MVAAGNRYNCREAQAAHGIQESTIDGMVHAAATVLAEIEHGAEPYPWALRAVRVARCRGAEPVGCSTLRIQHIRSTHFHPGGKSSQDGRSTE